MVEISGGKKWEKSGLFSHARELWLKLAVGKSGLFSHARELWLKLAVGKGRKNGLLPASSVAPANFLEMALWCCNITTNGSDLPISKT